MMLYMEYHFLFLKNFHQMTMPRMASSRRMMPANIILFVKTLQKHSCLSLKPHYQWEKWAKGDWLGIKYRVHISVRERAKKAALEMTFSISSHPQLIKVKKGKEV